MTPRTKAGSSSRYPINAGWLGRISLLRHRRQLAVFLHSMPDVIIGILHGYTKVFHYTFEMQYPFSNRELAVVSIRQNNSGEARVIRQIWGVSMHSVMLPGQAL